MQIKCTHRISIRLVVAGLLLVAVFGTSLPCSAAVDASVSLGSLQVLGVHKIADDDASLLKSDYIGATVRVRLRYEAPKNAAVYLYSPSECPPQGYVLERRAGKVTWLASSRTGDPSVSPGYLKLKAQLGPGWVYLPPGAAIEWDVDTEPTVSGLQRALSVFATKDKGNSGVEVISTWFDANFS